MFSRRWATHMACCPGCRTGGPVRTREDRLPSAQPVAPLRATVEYGCAIPMELDHLRALRYRSLRDVDLPLARLSVFIGANASGKSFHAFEGAVKNGGVERATRS